MTDTGTVVVPPALVALQVIVSETSPGLVVTQPDGFEIGDSGSVSLQLTVTGPVYQPFAPSGTGGVIVGVTTGGVVSRACTRALSAST